MVILTVLTNFIALFSSSMSKNFIVALRPRALGHLVYVYAVFQIIVFQVMPFKAMLQLQKNENKKLLYLQVLSTLFLNGKLFLKAKVISHVLCCPSETGADLPK